MYRDRGSLHPLWVAAALGGLLVWWLIKPDPTPDEALVGLVGRLTALQASSTVLASAIVAAASILAAIAIPLVTVWALIRSDEQTRPHEPTPVLPADRDQQRLPASPPPADLPACGDPQTGAALQVPSEPPTPRGDHETRLHLPVASVRHLKGGHGPASRRS